MLHLSRYHYNFHFTNEETDSKELSDFQGTKLCAVFIARDATEQHRGQMPECRQHPNTGHPVGAKAGDEPPPSPGFHTGMPAGSISAQHIPEVFLPAAFRMRTTGSFCPRLCGARGAAAAAAGESGVEVLGLRRQTGP